MQSVFVLLAGLAALLAMCGLAAAVAAGVAVRHFAARAPCRAHHRPAITVLKPLCGGEPLLEAALSSICAQDYPTFQIVFGAQDADDPALLTVRRMQELFPACEIAVVVDAARHGANVKISNLMNMMRAAKHDVLVLSDSDLHVASDYLERVVAALETPGTGLVTTVCLGLPTTGGLAARLGATGISHSFLPGALLSRALGREDALGTTMALRRDTLTQVGGLGRLVRHLADDNVLGQRVQQLGLRIALANTVPMTAVPEKSLRALWDHELRWARTIRALEPALFAASALQFPLFWAAAACVLSGGSTWAMELFAVAWIVRAAAAQSIDRALLRKDQPAGRAPLSLLPFRDFMSVSEIAASYLSGHVVWRGNAMRADDGCSAEVE